MEVELAGTTEPATRERLQNRIDGWKATIARYDTEPETQEGRKELVARAKAAEARRDISSARDDKYDIVSGLLQIAIVISSAAIITGVAMLAWTGGALGLLGLGLMVLAESHRPHCSDHVRAPRLPQPSFLRSSLKAASRRMLQEVPEHSLTILRDAPPAERSSG